MKALYRWIEEKAASGMDVGTLSEKLTMLGMEVEKCHHRGGTIDGLVVGEVLECGKHPDSDHLSVCRVRLPDGEAQIVCGADNVRAGIKVVVATVGCELPGGFKIKKAKIRGTESLGMICSKEELGLEEKSRGIWILPGTACIGLADESILGAEDWALDIAVTSNRSDCLSINGLAREAAAAAGKTFVAARPSIVEAPGVPAPAIEIRDPDLCARYASRLVRGVKVGPSPDWMVARLEACGMRGINNIVDVTNYVLLEYGHPLHAFDLKKLAGGRIVVRRAVDGEVLHTLDGQERALASTMLVIADERQAIGLAGVMGGANSEVDETTVDLLVESAWFDPISIRRTGKKLGISSEASYRFERTADHDGVLAALDRTVELILATAGGQAGKLTDIRAREIPARTVELEYGFIEKLLGIAPPLDDAIRILSCLDYTVARNGERLTIGVPTWRSDVSLPADIAEEIARFYGYDRLPARLFPIRVNDEMFAAADMTKRMLQDELAAAGLREALNFNFVLSEDLAVFSIDPASCVQVSNPMSADQKYLRPSLLPNLVGNARTNLGRGVRDMAFFEIGKVFTPGQDIPQESLSVAVLACGRAVVPQWTAGDGREYDFFDVKGFAVRILGLLGLKGCEFRALERAGWHPGRTAGIYFKDELLGYAGEMHPAAVKALDMACRPVMMEIRINPALCTREQARQVEEPSRFPSLLRDLAFVVADEVAGGAVLETIRSAASHLHAVRLLSVWHGEQIGAGNKSLAFSLEFSCAERTLADDEIEAILRRVRDAVEKAHGARLR